MGIRFFCPNGHKLNVKEFLAGKRGICPTCDARFLVPLESGGQAEALVESVAAAEPVPMAAELSQSPAGESPAENGITRSPTAVPTAENYLPQESEVVEAHRRLIRERRRRARRISLLLLGLILVMGVILAILLWR